MSNNCVFNLHAIFQTIALREQNKDKQCHVRETVKERVALIYKHSSFVLCSLGYVQWASINEVDNENGFSYSKY